MRVSVFARAHARARVARLEQCGGLCDPQPIGLALQRPAHSARLVAHLPRLNIQPRRMQNGAVGHALCVRETPRPCQTLHARWQSCKYQDLPAWENPVQA
eukprot:5102078-Pleurochrysis_carterae.AAC.9